MDEGQRQQLQAQPPQHPLRQRRALRRHRGAELRFQRGVARDQAKGAEAVMAAKGLAVNDITPAERQRMRAQVKPVWDMFTKDVGAELVTEVTGQLSSK